MNIFNMNIATEIFQKRSHFFSNLMEIDSKTPIGFSRS